MYKLIYDLRKIPVLRVLIPFTLGLALAKLFPAAYTIAQYGLIVFTNILILFIIHQVERTRKHHFHSYIGLMLFILFVLSGILSCTLTTREFRRDLNNEELVIIGKVMEPLIEKEKSLVTKIECSHIYMRDSLSGFDQNIVVYIGKDSIFPEMIPGEIWAFGGELSLIKNRGKPGEFDYKSYMQRRDFAYTLFVKGFNQANLVSADPRDLKYYPSRIRKRIIDTWEQSEGDIAILSALTLGYKSLLDADTKKSFSDAGAMHLLAVSGLHVGMIWWILDLLLRVPRNSNFWRTFKFLMILSILWFYAGITGFSDSVTRSVTMFSLVAFSKTIRRGSNVFNTLLLSAFILLLLKPSRIMEPGFQLSYVAVLGIITIQPMFASLFKSTNRILKWMLDLISVSFAAQISTLPFVFLYFNQFPVWFLLTNMLAIPLVSIILALFVLFSPFFLLYPDFSFFTNLLLLLTHILDLLVHSISSLPFAVIEDIPMTPLISVIMVFSLISILLFVYYKRAFYLILSLCCLILLITFSGINNYKAFQKKDFEIYNISDLTIVSSLQKMKRNTYLLSHTDTLDQYAEEFLKSLNRMPGAIKSHNMIDLNKLSGTDHSSVYSISNDLWGIKANNKNILLAGKCRSDKLLGALTLQNWDVLVLSRGFPKEIEEVRAIDSIIKIVADGSLRAYELEALERIFEDAYIIDRDGVFCSE